MTFSNNALYYTKGEGADLTEVKYVGAASKSKLNSNNTFVERNTRRYGNGTSYADGGLYSFNEDITLYASGNRI